ncbi:MAG: hypothetical protein ACI84C_000909 [Flavobacteriales bacterium]|jgi:hypothetical protein
MVNKLGLIAFVLLLINGSLLAQEDDLKANIIEQRVETIAELAEEDSDVDYTTLFDDLSYFYDKPLNLNQATVSDLQKLHLLNDFQIQALLDHIDKHGMLMSKFELQAVDGFDLITIRNLEPFVNASPPLEFTQMTVKELLGEGQHDLFLRYTTVLQQQQGYTAIAPEDLAESPNSRYQGNNARYYLRYRYRYRNNLSIGLTAEKDPGEQFLKGSQKNGFDFYSAHLFYSDKGWLKKIAVGDYQAQFGQGLTLWSGLAFGKSSYALQVKRVGRGLAPYTSVDENRFLRGAGFTVGGNKIELTGFFSRKRIDANTALAQDSLTGEDILTVTSFQQSGFHRTPGELEDKDAITETHIGANLKYHTRSLHIGLSAVMNEYDTEVNRNLSTYNQFDFNANQNVVVGLNYGWIKKNVNIFGETARSLSGGMASINGALISMHPKLAISVVHRYYQRDFQNPLGNAFGEGGSPSNESGIYLGLEYKVSKKFTLTAYADQFKFPWLKFQSDKSTSGYDALVQLTYKPSRGSEFYVRYRTKIRDYNSQDDAAIIDYVSTRIKQSARINARYPINENFTLRTRIELLTFQHQPNEQERGYLMFQDVLFKKLEWPFTLAIRYALFDTPSYNSRIYAYENDLLYTWSIPAYYDQGSRFYFMVKWRVYRKVDLWLRYSQWHYSHRDDISSGLSEITGNKKGEFKAQLRVRF